MDLRPKLVVDPHLRVLWCCDAAQRLLVPPLPLQLRDGQLLVGDRAQGREFADFIQGVGTAMRQKLVRGKSSRHWVLVRAWRSAATEGAVCILCVPSLPTCDIAASGLAEALGLTHAETRVLRSFAELNSPSEIASNLGISLGTVRSHFKTIYAKASVSTSTQLLRLAHTFCSS